MSYMITCPYCGGKTDWRQHNVDTHDEAINIIECPHCDKQFRADTIVMIDFNVSKCDCQNDGKHDWRLTTTMPKALSRMECSMCGEQRELTDDERKQYDIPTLQEYLDSLKAQSKKQ